MQSGLSHLGQHCCSKIGRICPTSEAAFIRRGTQMSPITAQRVPAVLMLAKDPQSCIRHPGTHGRCPAQPKKKKNPEPHQPQTCIRCFRNARRCLQLGCEWQEVQERPGTHQLDAHGGQTVCVCVLLADTPPGYGRGLGATMLLILAALTKCLLNTIRQIS